VTQSIEDIAESDRKLVRVTCEGLPDDFSVEAYSNGFRWKGYATPLFAMEAGLALCKVVPEKLSYDASRRAFRYIDIDADHPEVEWIEPEKYDIGGALVELFMIGENWCWELADDCNAGTAALDLAQFQSEAIAAAAALDALYPFLHIEIHMRDDTGRLFEWPRIGYINGGQFISGTDAAAESNMTPVDAVYLDFVNGENGTLAWLADMHACFAKKDGAPVWDPSSLDCCVWTLQEWAQIDTGDVAGLFFGGTENGQEWADWWPKATPSEKRSKLLEYLRYESQHEPEERLREYRRADYNGA
jgi:hypothetical protein